MPVYQKYFKEPHRGNLQSLIKNFSEGMAHVVRSLPPPTLSTIAILGITHPTFKPLDSRYLGLLEPLGNLLDIKIQWCNQLEPLQPSKVVKGIKLIGPREQVSAGEFIIGYVLHHLNQVDAKVIESNTIKIGQKHSLSSNYYTNAIYILKKEISKLLENKPKTPFQTSLENWIIESCPVDFKQYHQTSNSYYHGISKKYHHKRFIN